MKVWHDNSLVEPCYYWHSTVHIPNTNSQTLKHQRRRSTWMRSLFKVWKSILKPWRRGLQVTETVDLAVYRSPTGDSGAMFLYRKVLKAQHPCVLLAGPHMNATNEEIDDWLRDYNSHFSNPGTYQVCRPASACMGKRTHIMNFAWNLEDATSILQTCQSLLNFECITWHVTVESRLFEIQNIQSTVIVLKKLNWEHNHHLGTFVGVRNPVKLPMPDNVMGSTKIQMVCTSCGHGVLSLSIIEQMLWTENPPTSTM